MDNTLTFDTEKEELKLVNTGKEEQKTAEEAFVFKESPKKKNEPMVLDSMVQEVFTKNNIKSLIAKGMTGEQLNSIAGMMSQNKAVKNSTKSVEYQELMANEFGDNTGFMVTQAQQTLENLLKNEPETLEFLNSKQGKTKYHLNKLALALGKSEMTNRETENNHNYKKVEATGQAPSETYEEKTGRIMEEYQALLDNVDIPVNEKNANLTKLRKELKDSILLNA